MHSESIANLAAALCKAQAAMKAAPMNATNPFLKNRYADLGSIIETGRKPLADNGLSYSQLAIGDAHTIGVETILMHDSGEWISSIITLDTSDEKGKSSAQVAGSIISYLRRYSLASILGIYADEDTDGNEPKKPQAKPQTSAPVHPQSEPEPPEPVTGPPTMTLEEAENVTNSEGVRYGDIPVDKLSYMHGSITKKIRTAPQATEADIAALAEYMHKRDAIQVILANRK